MTPFRQRIADVTANGTAGALDASGVVRYVAGFIPAMSDNPAASLWIFDPVSLTVSPDSDTAGQDFGVSRTGDMSGSWTPGPPEKTIRYPSRAKEIIANPGETLSIPVVLSQDAEIRGIDIVAESDGNVLKATDVTLAGGILENSDYELIANTGIPGKVALGIFPWSGPVTGSGTILSVRFHVLGKEGTSSLLRLTWFDLDEIPVSEGDEGYRDASVVTGGFRTDDGTVSHALRISVGRPYDPLTYDLDQDGTITLQDSIYGLIHGDLESAIRALQSLTSQ
jgi:hypothetical protein